jgi:hypothetical protein
LSPDSAQDLLDPALLATAREETTAICRGLRGEVDGLTPDPLCVHFPHKVSR